MMAMTIEQAAKAVGGELCVGLTPADSRIEKVVTDSRLAGVGSLFVAIAGEHVDGHRFVGQVYHSGAVAALVDHEIAGAEITQIVVPDTIRAMGLLAKANIEERRAFDSPFTVVGVTGSVGKTTTKDLLKALLSTRGETIAPVGSFNNDIGMPITALEVNERTRFLVAEMGANHLGEIANLGSLVPPDIAIVLKVGVAHLGEFGSVENIQRAKSEIIRALVPDGVAVLNADDEHVVPMASIAPGDVVWFGLGSGAEVKAYDITADGRDRAGFTLSLPGHDPVRVQLAIPGRHNVMNALAAIAVATREDVPVDEIVRVLGEQTAISPHRMTVFGLTRAGVSFTVIDDSFNANPDSMKAGLDGLAGWSVDEDGVAPFRVAVLGSMLELGENAVELHRGIGSYAARLGIDAVIGVGSRNDAQLDSLASDFIEGIDGDDETTRNKPFVALVHDVDEADRLVLDLAREHENTVVLLKGSHASGLSALAARWDANDDLPTGSDATDRNGEAQ
ncbi:UDP-N-acetylmuramoyl-tripeptide--D-alanyl-D- alan ine ligase [Bifidobacterium margollesii]|uniref:UDP-N-acetylmuramoyl-tripeptide--D-alanyl-D-alanine ligase n=1 Tax=Bifidobacterium margollesii TaxID=2020964 RepID=A0A2N5JBJ1_9BIFI|nr:UDP-N-acetylmuramoyl-tripeptide--D-alanyl-D-alanine ligase [Bifidobacterium margollesii]PLS31577.1 UDP-N-acetylmuramoyl-tripeptide--D-alanyl-D- alan ine ligase [Bifidobacterium margollesii]